MDVSIKNLEIKKSVLMRQRRTEGCRVFGFSEGCRGDSIQNRRKFSAKVEIIHRNVL